MSGERGAYSRRDFVRKATELAIASSFAGGATALLEAGSASGAQRGGRVVFSTPHGQEPNSLFAGVNTTAVGTTIFSFTGNGLTKIRRPNMNVVPDLATWTVSADNLAYTFRLRSGVKWQDGQPFDAQDVKFTLEYLGHPDFPRTFPDLNNVDGAAAYKKGQASSISGITITGPAEVQFKLLAPSALFLPNLASLTLLPRHILQTIAPANAAKSSFARKPIYTGPYRVQEWRPGDSITFDASPHYFGGHPSLDRLVMKVISDDSALNAQLSTGEIHLALIDPDHFQNYVGKPEYTTQELAGLSNQYLQFDLTNPSFSDPRVRQAMSHAIDRQSVVKSFLKGLGDPSYAFASPTAFIFNPNAPKFPYDLQRANALLDEAGWRMGPDGVRADSGRRLEFKMNVVSTASESVNGAQVVQPFLEKVGIKYSLNLMDQPSLIGTLRPGSYQSVWGGWTNGIIDPRRDLLINFLSPRSPDQTGYNNSQVNKAISSALTASPREQSKLWQQIESLIDADAPLVYLWRARDLVVTRSTLSVPKVTTFAELMYRLPEWRIT